MAEALQVVQAMDATEEALQVVMTAVHAVAWMGAERMAERPEAAVVVCWAAVAAAAKAGETVVVAV